MFQGVGRHFVPYINKTYQRRGSLWEGRHKGHIFNSEDYFLMCMRYIEMNPVRAGMVEHPAQYRWSSYTANAQGIDNAIIRPHERYLSLGKSPEARQTAYRGLFTTAIHPDELDLIRASLHSGTPLGNERFKQQIESAVGYITSVLASEAGLSGKESWDELTRIFAGYQLIARQKRDITSSLSISE